MRSASAGVLLASWCPRNIVVTPGRAFRMRGLVPQALVCPHSGIVEPGVSALIWQMAFALFDVVDEAAEVGAAPTAVGYAAGSGEDQLLAAVVLEGYIPRMPLVGLTERDFTGLVVGSDVLDDLRHGRLPLSSAVSSAGRSYRAAWLVGRVADPSLEGGQVAVLRLRVKVCSPRNGCTILLGAGVGI